MFVNDGVTLSFLPLILLPFAVATAVIYHTARLRRSRPMAAYPRRDDDNGQETGENN